MHIESGNDLMNYSIIKIKIKTKAKSERVIRKSDLNELDSVKWMSGRIPVKKSRDKIIQHITSHNFNSTETYQLAVR